jgi:hypothetical protein
MPSLLLRLEYDKIAIHYVKTSNCYDKNADSSGAIPKLWDSKHQNTPLNSKRDPNP